MTSTAAHTVPLAALAARLTGPLHRAGAPGFAAAAGDPPATPAVAVAEAAGPADVAACVRFATEHGLGVAEPGDPVPAGGPVLLVATGRLRELHVDPAGAVVRAGAGVRWGEVVAAAARHGLAALGPAAPDRGVAAHLTGGGLGPLDRSHGLGTDRVTAFEVVTGDGRHRRVTPDAHPDLFRGLRGGGPALGVVTAVEFGLVPLSTVLGGALHFAAGDVAVVARAWAEWTAVLPSQATSSLAVLRGAGAVTAAVRVAWTGDVAAGLAVLRPLLEVADPVAGGLGVLPYADVRLAHADVPVPGPVSATGTLLSGLPGEAVDRLLAVAGPGAACPQHVVEVRHLGGAVRREPPHPDCVEYRDDAYALRTAGPAAAPLAAATRAHAEQVLAAVRPWDTGRCLPGSATTGVRPEATRRWSRATLGRLAAASRRHDPAGVLAAAAAIRAAAPPAPAAT